jgi:hypothetical protein
MRALRGALPLNFVTHLQMAGVLYGELCRVVDLDRESFIYGNVKPDCSLKGVLLPHTLTNYFDRVLDLADRLMEEDLTKQVYSEGLGVLCHFLSDFYCLYHAKEEKFNHYMGHAVYEIRLHNFHKKKEPSFLKNIFSFKPNLAQDLRQTIIDFREEYFSRPHSLELDFFYAYRLCKLACQSVAYYRSGRIVCDQAVYHGQPAYVKVGEMR